MVVVVGDGFDGGGGDGGDGGAGGYGVGGCYCVCSSCGGCDCDVCFGGGVCCDGSVLMVSFDDCGWGSDGVCGSYGCIGDGGGGFDRDGDGWWLW